MAVKEVKFKESARDRRIVGVNGLGRCGQGHLGSGVKIVLPIEQPLRQIARNASDEPSVVIAKVLEGKGNFGYNAQTGEYGDMVAMGCWTRPRTRATRCRTPLASSR